jgi:hypothetical protein
MKAKKNHGKPATKRATKDLTPKKTSGVKGGFVAVEHSSIGGGKCDGPDGGSFFSTLAKALDKVTK